MLKETTQELELPQIFKEFKMGRWKTIKGYEKMYQISKSGEVRSLPRTILTSNGIVKRIQGRILNSALNSTQTLGCILSKEGEIAWLDICKTVKAYF